MGHQDELIPSPESKESKRLGLRKPCPTCKETLIKSANMVGSITGKIFLNGKCPECGEQLTIELGQRPYMKVYKTVKALAYIFIILALGYQVFSLTGLNIKVAMLIQNINYAADNK